MKNNVSKGILRKKVLIFVIRTLVKKPIAKMIEFSDKEHKINSTPYLVFANHTYALDPVFIIKTMKRYVRYVMSDHVMRSGFVGKIYKFLDSPIIFEREKGTDPLFNDIVANIKAGINVAMYPEGCLTNTGETGFISKRNATLVKECDCTFVTYRTKGGYLKKPRWSKNARKGPLKGEIVNIYTQEQIRAMTEDEIYAHIIEDLHFNAYDEQRTDPAEYICEDPAEYAETILYGCPKCNAIGALRTKGDKIFCTCGFSATIDKYGFWNSDDMDFDNIPDWDKFQKKLIKTLTDNAKNTSELLISDSGQQIYSIENGEMTTLTENGAINLFGDKLELISENETISILLSEINSIKVSAIMNLLLVTEKGYFEVRSSYPRSATKYIVATRYLQGKENL